MGIEDGVSLAECLARATDASEMSKCLHASETIRKPRPTKTKGPAALNRFTHQIGGTTSA